MYRELERNLFFLKDPNRFWDRGFVQREEVILRKRLVNKFEFS